jgi:hypothetical protein
MRPPSHKLTSQKLQNQPFTPFFPAAAAAAPPPPRAHNVPLLAAFILAIATSDPRWLAGWLSSATSLALSLSHLFTSQTLKPKTLNPNPKNLEPTLNAFSSPFLNPSPNIDLSPKWLTFFSLPHLNFKSKPLCAPKKNFDYHHCHQSLV